jgi:hypothetical protein
LVAADFSEGDVMDRVYLIRKGGYFYRPNSQGYTVSPYEAGRYTLSEAESITHPNGPDGPRDGMSYVHESEVAPPVSRSAAMSDLDALKEALLKVEGNRPDSLGISTQWHRNPEGPEAWAVIEAAQSENARLQHDLEVTGAQYARVSAENAKLRAELAAARESALEEAAKVADEDAEHDWSDGVPRGGMIATAIRALKGTPPHE